MAQLGQYFTLSPIRNTLGFTPRDFGKRLGFRYSCRGAAADNAKATLGGEVRSHLAHFSAILIAKPVTESYDSTEYIVCVSVSTEGRDIR